MDTELLKLFQEAVEKGLTTRIVLILSIGVLIAGAAAFYGSYFKKKAEQRAITENFENVLEQIKDQKKATEAMKD
jgi:hypothetical protein